MAQITRIFIAATASVAAATFITGCGSDGSNESSAPASDSPSSTASSSASPTQSKSDVPEALCSLAAVKKAIPTDTKVLKFQCTTVNGTPWAIVSTNPGPEVFFLRGENNRWVGQNASEVCGTASAGLPDEILNYCPGA